MQMTSGQGSPQRRSVRRGSGGTSLNRSRLPTQTRWARFTVGAQGRPPFITVPMLPCSAQRWTGASEAAQRRVESELHRLGQGAGTGHHTIMPLPEPPRGVGSCGDDLSTHHRASAVRSGAGAQEKFDLDSTIVETASRPRPVRQAPGNVRQRQRRRSATRTRAPTVGGVWAKAHTMDRGTQVVRRVRVSKAPGKRLARRW